MYMPFANEEPEKYKDYKNRTVMKTVQKVSSVMWGIRSNSLKKEDKEKLKRELLNTIESFNFN